MAPSRGGQHITKVSKRNEKRWPPKKKKMASSRGGQNITKVSKRNEKKVATQEIAEEEK